MYSSFDLDRSGNRASDRTRDMTDSLGIADRDVLDDSTNLTNSTNRINRRDSSEINRMEDDRINRREDGASDKATRGESEVDEAYSSRVEPPHPGEPSQHTQPTQPSCSQLFGDTVTRLVYGRLTLAEALTAAGTSVSTNSVLAQY